MALMNSKGQRRSRGQRKGRRASGWGASVGTAGSASGKG